MVSAGKMVQSRIDAMASALNLSARATCRSIPTSPPSPGMDIDLTYFYNASSTSNGAFGYVWPHSLNSDELFRQSRRCGR